MNWYSQAGQDRWVHTVLDGRVGYFVDVGAYDGVESSNTYALEQLGWDGVCIEASPSMAAACAHNRRCTTVGRAVAEREGFVRFAGDRVVASGGIQVPCSPLGEILRSVRAPRQIDYLSLDVEGHELIALQGIDFDYYTVLMITVEHNLYANGPAYKHALWEYLDEHGFVRVIEDALCIAPDYPQYHMQPYEDWYVNRSVPLP
jgi:FkbM family methyltransferase